MSLLLAMLRLIKKNARNVFGDDKWQSEEKGTVLEFEARKESPVVPQIRFKLKTKVQRVRCTVKQFAPRVPGLA